MSKNENLDGVVPLNLNLNGHEVVAKVTFQVMLDTERDLGISIIEFANKILTARYSLREVSIFLSHAIRASEGFNSSAATPSKVAEQLWISGIANDNLIKALGKVAVLILTGGSESTEQKKTDEAVLNTP